MITSAQRAMAVKKKLCKLLKIQNIQNNRKIHWHTHRHLALLDFGGLCMTILTMYDYLWLCMTMYDFVR